MTREAAVLRRASPGYAKDAEVVPPPPRSSSRACSRGFRPQLVYPDPGHLMHQVVVHRASFPIYLSTSKLLDLSIEQILLMCQGRNPCQHQRRLLRTLLLLRGAKLLSVHLHHASAPVHDDDLAVAQPAGRFAGADDSGNAVLSRNQRSVGCKGAAIGDHGSGPPE